MSDFSWMRTELPEEERLVKFEAWLATEMRRHIQWPDGPAGEKLLFQCREILRVQLRVLADRGFLLDSKALAQFLVKPIEEIGRIQKEIGISNLYAYFTRKFCRYVDERAEDIKAHSKRIGHHFTNFDGGHRTLPEIEAERHAESLREKAARVRRRRRESNSNQGQRSLF